MAFVHSDNIRARVMLTLKAADLKGENSAFSTFFFNHVFIRRIIWSRDNLLTNNKFLDWSKLKAFADDKINVT